jgi:diguanylate cyclase (GGDEF)-like protein
MVQPHGALLVVEYATRVVTHASENTLEVIGLDPRSLLGQPLTSFLGSPTIDAMKAVLDDEEYASNPIPVTIGERRCDVIVHRAGESVIIEFEPFAETSPEMTLRTRRAMRRFARASSVAELWALAADEFRKITGFDRVMVENFDQDGHGEIVAESVTPDLQPRLGLRIPASTIVPHAVTLAALKRSRLIVNTARPAVALLGDPERATPGVDLSRAELRAVTAHHLAFMREHDMTSSFTLSLVRDKSLIGIIIGGHRSERRLPYNIRDGFEILANQVSLQLAAMRDIEQLAKRDELRELRAALDAQLARSGDVVEALLTQHVTLLDLIPADGVAVKVGDRVESKGTVPEPAVLADLSNRLLKSGAPLAMASSTLPGQYPELAAQLPGFAGLLTRPLSHDGDYLAWFRRERARFAGWTDEFAGTAEPWEGMERQARELVRDLQTTLLRQAESRLAELALEDPLTGLPNRRLLMDRLTQELSRPQSGSPLAVLFIDLDDFKQINDSIGHSAGDAVLRHAALALRSAARGVDTVARLGGDEFVVLGHDLNEADAFALAERLLTAIAAPPTAGPGAASSTWRVSASAGLVLARFGDDPSHVLSAADSALYRAKVAGKGRVSL